MSTIDSELTLLRQRLQNLEMAKEIESKKEEDKSAFPLKTLECIIDEKKKRIENSRYKSAPRERFYDQEKVDMLEPIFNMLKDIQRRLELLESK